MRPGLPQHAPETGGPVAAWPARVHHRRGHRHVSARGACSGGVGGAASRALSASRGSPGRGDEDSSRRRRIQIRPSPH
jgi:hypothetical protein